MILKLPSMQEIAKVSELPLAAGCQDIEVTGVSNVNGLL